jgi:hypothetical protein
MTSKALVLGIIHFFLQFFVTFFGLIFMDMLPVPGSLGATSVSLTGIVMNVLTFPMVQLRFPFYPLDTGFRIFVVLLANSILWTCCSYLLLRMITALRQDRAKSRSVHY